MKKLHTVTFPRFQDDIMSERRTLFHVPVDGKTWERGANLYLRCTTHSVRRKLGVLTSACQVRLLAELDADLGKLCADRTTYLASWDALRPELPSADDPLVWRIEFRYGAWEADPADPPEWSLAS